MLRTCECGCNIVHHWCGEGFCSGEPDQDGCECKRFQPNEEGKVYKVHAEVARRLQYALRVWSQQAQDAEALARKCKQRISSVKNAVFAGHWHLLKDELEEREIKLLSDTPPDDRMSLLNNKWK